MSTPAPGRARTSSLALSTAVVEETVGSVSDACCHPVTNGGNGKQENSGLKHGLGKEGPQHPLLTVFKHGYFSKTLWVGHVPGPQSSTCQALSIGTKESERVAAEKGVP